ncbi:MAG: RNA polymerase sigma factor [Longimicrobiaceae bacterium]
MDLSDSELVRRAREGDIDAYAVLVRRYHPPCMRFATRMLRERADAEEAVQDAFTSAYRALGRYRDRHRFQTWLMQILVNRCRSVLRRRRREPALVACEAAEMKAETEDAWEPSWSIEVQEALMRLPPALREAVLLHFVDGYRYREIARLTGAGVSAVKMRVKRGREQLRALLEARYDARSGVGGDRA